MIKCVILSLFFSISFYSQNEKKQIDSLEKILPYLEKNSNKIEILFTLSKLNQKVSKEKSEYFNNSLFNLAKKVNSKKGFAYYHLNNAYLFYVNGNYNKSIDEAQKAEIYFTQLNEKALFLDALYFHCFSLSFVNRGKEAFDYAYEQANLPLHKKYYQQIAQLNYFLAYYCFSIEDSSLAIYHNLLALENYRKIKNELGILKCYYNMTDIYIYTGQYESAKSYGYKTLQLLNKFNTPVKELQSGLYGTLAKIHLHFKDYEKAKNYCSQALKLNQELGSKDYIGMNLIVSMDIDIAEQNYSSLYEKAKKVLSISKTEFNIIKANYYLGVYFNKSKKYNIAKKYLNVAFKKITYENKKVHRKMYLELAFVEENLKNYSAANVALKSYYDLELNYYKKQIDNRINELQNQFDIKEKNIELKQLKLKQEKNNIELQNQQNFIMFSIILISLFIVIIVILVFAYKINSNKKSLLHIERDKFNEALKERELLLKEIHHRVKNNLQLVISLLNIQSQDKNEISIEDFLQKSQNRIATMALIHQNLYLSDSVTNIKFESYIESLINHIKSTFDKSDVEFEIKSENIFFDIETAIPLGLIVNELVTNSLKHAFVRIKNPKISIILQENIKNEYVLYMRDNGVGYNSDNVSQSKSIGLELVNLLVMQLKGKIVNIEETIGICYKINFKKII